MDTGEAWWKSTEVGSGLFVICMHCVAMFVVYVYIKVYLNISIDKT